MKILFVSDYYPNPGQPQFCIFLQQQARALMSLGHTVEVIVPQSTCGLHEKIIRKRMAGINVCYAQYFTLYKRIYCRAALLRNIRQFGEFFDFGSYDIISLHMFDEFTLRIFSGISKRYGIKLVVHFHGLSVLYDNKLPLSVRILQRRGDRILKKLVSGADAIVGVSNKVCDRVKAAYDNRQVFTVYNGVDMELFRPAGEKEKKDYTVISVASLKKIKGNHYLLDAFKMLTDKYTDRRIKLVIIGHGPERAALRAQVKDLGLEGKVRFIGYIGYERVARIMRGCDVFAMPSYYEALGCAYLEAMASRLPVIGCRLQGIDEIITDGENGFLVEPHNAGQIFEKLDYLLQHPEEAENIALKGYRTVENGFTWLDSAKSLTEVYHKLLKGNTQPQACVGRKKKGRHG
jgi:glycosyltransferase involved in cell wall biosynthesis